MNVIVTGSAGFIGSYLISSLLKDGNNVYSVARTDSPLLRFLRNGSKFYSCDFTNTDSVKEMIRALEPDVVYHLAAQSYILPSWKDPYGTFNINVNATIALLEELRNSKIDAKIHLVCSAAQYGSVDKEDIPIHEDVKFRPSSPYAVSKLAEDMTGYSYWKSYGMKITRSRPFAITGPGKLNDALSDWSQNIVEIERQRKKDLVTGNLSAIRDFLDVRDCVAGLISIMNQGKWGEAYNICSGKGISLEKIIEILRSLSKKPFEKIQDPKRLRPSDDPILIGDNKKLRSLGWDSEIPIEKTIEDTLNFWRNHDDS
jgi:GDP-4-dehydro-6-deoxy-D-mannose reductase